MKPVLFLILVGLFGSLLPESVLAQTILGTIRGMVTDASNAALPGATVTVTSLNTGISRIVLTDDAGRYAVLSLPAAPYEMTVELASFTSSHRARITLEVAQSLAIDFVLQVAGRAEEKVVVTAEAPLVSQDSAELGGSMDPKRLVELPISGRDFTRFSLLVPGAAAYNSSIISLTFNGYHIDHNSHTIDGMDASAVTFPTVANGYERGTRLLTGSLDSIQEFRVHTSNYAAEYGRSAGAVVNIVTKSGGNDVHGTVFEFLRNSALDARNFFSRSDQPKPLFILNQFGGNVSGPIVKNQTFFFVNYEGSRQRLGLTSSGTVPSLALRQRALATSPALAPLLATIPLGTSPTSNPDIDNVTVTRPLSVREDTGSIKVDHRFSEQDSIFARYNLNDTRVVGTLLGINNAAINYLATDQTQVTPNRTTNVTVQEQHTFSASMVNEFKAGMQRVADHVIFNSKLPLTTINGLTIQPGASNGTRVDGLTSLQAIDHLSISRGPHVFKTGFEVRRVRANFRTDAWSNMTYNNLNDFVRNSVLTANLTPATPGRGLRQTQYGFYFQDDFKARRNLTFDLGIRYEYYTVLREVRDRVQVFNPLTGDLDPPGAPFYRPDRNNVAPRFGVAWSPTGSDRTVVRGGFGLYYQSLPIFFLTISSNIYANNLPGATNLLRVQIPDLSFPLEPFIGSGATPPPSVQALAPSRRDLYTEQWNLTLEHALGPDMVLQVAYVGNHGVNVYRTRNINLFDPGLGRRPNPRFSNITLHENTAQMIHHALQASWRRRFSRGLALDMAYAYSHAIDDVQDAPANLPGPQDTNNLRAERGNSSRDIRHNGIFSVLYDLPVGSGHRFLGGMSGVLGQLLGGWQLNGLGALRTGWPFSVELGGASPSGNQNTINQRPGRVAGVASQPVDRSIDHWLNREAFAVPRPGTFGNLGRNTEYGPGFVQFDVSLLKTTKLRESKSLQFRAEFFNLLNHPNFVNPTATLSNPAFGRVLGTYGRTIGFGTPRQIQFGLKFLF